MPDPVASGDPAARSTDIDLINALARLDPDDRALLALRYVAGFDSTELARATGRSASGTRARLARLLGNFERSSVMTDQTEFETMLERRMRAYAATGVRPVPAHEIAGSTMQAAATPVGRTTTLGGARRPALLVGLAAVLLLAAVAGAALIGGLRSPIQGVFVDGPILTDGHIANSIALPDGRVLVGVKPSARDGPRHDDTQVQPTVHAAFDVPRPPRPALFTPTTWRRIARTSSQWRSCATAGC